MVSLKTTWLPGFLSQNCNINLTQLIRVSHVNQFVYLKGDVSKCKRNFENNLYKKQNTSVTLQINN